MKVFALLLCFLCIFASLSFAQPVWQANLDSKIRFYQSTDFGIVLAGTEHSLYAIDGQTGERIWRRETGRVNETAVTPVPDTDLILFSRDMGSKSRLEAVDVLSGMRIWESEKVKGDVLQLAVDPASDLVAVVLVKEPLGNAGSEFKGKPIVHVMRLSSGVEIWKRELDSDIEMMPSRFDENLGEIAYTLDNYRAPLLLDGRLFLFYDGATSYDARTGKEKEREKFKINEDGLALTEADPVFDSSRVYISGRGKIRAVNRQTGNVEWKADDLGNCAEMALIGDTLFVRTGGQFTRLKDGETDSKGPYGISAIDPTNGKTKWRYKGADKGLTNFVFGRESVLLIADKDDVIAINSKTGEKLWELSHKIDKPQFILLNERGDVVIGGRDEMVSLDFFMRADFSQTTTFVVNGKRDKTRPAFAEKWRVKHKPPSRGVFRIVAGIALRATALYFRYGGVATSAIGVARGGLGFASTVNSFRWSGLKARFGSFDLTTLASNAAKNYAMRKIYAYGSLARTSRLGNAIGGLQIERPNINLLGRATQSRADAQESTLDRLDPARQAEKLSNYLLRRKRLAELRGNYMYFYTDLEKPFDKQGLVGVNVHTGMDGRFILNSDPDPQFFVDEAEGLLYSSDGNRLQAFDILNR